MYWCGVNWPRANGFEVSRLRRQHGTHGEDRSGAAAAAAAAEGLSAGVLKRSHLRETGLDVRPFLDFSRAAYISSAGGNERSRSSHAPCGAMARILDAIHDRLYVIVGLYDARRLLDDLGCLRRLVRRL